VIDKALDWLARVIELALALAFIMAVLLNFGNVVGRYLFGVSFLASDEVQAEQILLLVLAAFVVSQSYFYAAQMLRIGRRSDMAGMPMWIPHGFLVVGFSLIFVVALWRLAGIVRSPSQPDGGAKS